MDMREISQPLTNRQVKAIFLIVILASAALVSAGASAGPTAEIAKRCTIPTSSIPTSDRDRYVGVATVSHISGIAWQEPVTYLRHLQ
jgi:hypothetical protein